MTLIDTNVLLDIATADPVWSTWSSEQLQASSAAGQLAVNPIIYAELSPAFATVEELNQWLDPEIFLRLPLPYEAGWIAAQAFVKYRREGGAKTAPLPDFYIGAHAEVEGHTLLTRDPARDRTYFPAVSLRAPE